VVVLQWSERCFRLAKSSQKVPIRDFVLFPDTFTTELNEAGVNSKPDMTRDLKFRTVSLQNCNKSGGNCQVLSLRDRTTSTTGIPILGTSISPYIPYRKHIYYLSRNIYQSGLFIDFLRCVFRVRICSLFLALASPCCEVNQDIK
jgi:hypothetical protein